MIKNKLKPCIICGRPSYWWSKKRCRACTIRESKYELKKSKINPISQKEKERKKIYMKLRKELLKKFPLCQVCNINKSTQCHHIGFREGENLFKNLLAVCMDCHRYIHEHDEESYEKGLLISKDKNKNRNSDINDVFL